MLKVRRFHHPAHRLRRYWARFLFAFGPFRLSVSGRENLVKGQSYIICANHTSYLDIPALAAAVPVFFRFLGKAELAKIPLFGIYFRTLDIPVKRESQKNSYEAFIYASQQLEKGDSIAIFPEGGIVSVEPKLNRFKSGAFRMAFDLNLPILPVTLLDNYRLLPDSKFEAHAGKCRVVIHKPVFPNENGIFDTKLLSDSVFYTLQNCLDTYANK